MIIYLVTNIINGKQYVGQTIRPLRERWRDHCRVKDDNYFHRAIRKYGADSFRLEVIDTAKSVEELDRKEIFWIKELNTLYPGGYNLKIGGDASMRGRFGMFNPKAKIIYQFTLDGAMVNGYYGVGDAARRTGISQSGIGRSAKRGDVLAGGCVWLWHSDDMWEQLIHRIDNYTGGRKQPVVCVETGEVFQSASDAARKYGTIASSVLSCCSGRLKTTAKKHWKYYEGRKPHGNTRAGNSERSGTT